jgi:L(+)-tartrate dehydratase alpha subunit
MSAAAPRPIPAKLIEDTARELTARAAIDIPPDYREGVVRARDRERGRLARFVLTEMPGNWDIATAERRPMCADTGLPRYYVKLGNEAVVEGGLVALERALRRATADATASIPLRPNRVHPLTRADRNDNVGIHAPEVTLAVEPGGDWIDVTTVHKGGLFGTDWRMLFPGDGVAGIKRFFVDTLIESGKRGLACQPAIVGVGIGGAKDTCLRLGKEAACLRVVGTRNPDPAAAALEDELTELGNHIGLGAMGFAGTSMVIATHVELAYTHTGGMPVGIHQFCLSSRRATARIHPDGRVQFRADPEWFTDYYRREGIE